MSGCWCTRVEGDADVRPVLMYACRCRCGCCECGHAHVAAVRLVDGGGTERQLAQPPALVPDGVVLQALQPQHHRLAAVACRVPLTNGGLQMKTRPSRRSKRSVSLRQYLSEVMTVLHKNLLTSSFCRWHHDHRNLQRAWEPIDQLHVLALL